MIFYIDRLTGASCRKAVDLKTRMGLAETVELRVLDPLPTGAGLRRRISRLGSGFSVAGTSFIAGRLRMPAGQPAYVAARRRANDVAILQARELLNRSDFLERLDREWGRHTILLHLARFLWGPTAQWLMRLFVADAFLRQSGRAEAVLLIMEPDVFVPEMIEGVGEGLTIERYKQPVMPALLKRCYPALWILRQRCRKVCWALNRSNSLRHLKNDGRGSLLVPHEDDLAMDRSYRTQPHWLVPEAGRPLFRTLILQSDTNRMDDAREQALGDDVQFIPQRQWAGASGTAAAKPLLKHLRKNIRACLRKSLLGGGLEVPSFFPLTRLFDTACDLAAFSSETGVRVFMTCENYLTLADAMQLIAQPLGIRTLSYQYSNMSRVGPIMLTTADTMATFSPLFHDRWAHDGISPGRFVDTGYVHDGAFGRIRERARCHRGLFLAAGARFIITYFDENAFPGKYELVTVEDHRDELLFLLRRVLEDSSFGLIVKTQFVRKSPGLYGELRRIVEQAAATGRYMELSHGKLRNIVFPAEAALAADMVIGHSVGATAALESALAGVRCILLNPYGIITENDSIYSRCDIVYASMEQAFGAIDRFRAGDPNKNALGDWAAVLPEFDPFRDQRAGKRLRALLDEEMGMHFSSNKVAPGAEH